jgi:pimeloyl-ACP methyl ester carboxylesterase
VRFFARRYRTIAYNARGYPPSDVPEDPKAYSQDQAADDIRGLLDALGIKKAHICGLSMGGYATLHFGLRYPERALSLVVAGAGYGSVAGEREKFRRDVEETAMRFERDGMKAVAEFYTKGPTRVQFMDKDPAGWQEFYDMFCEQSAKGHALTMRGVQMKRPSLYELTGELKKIDLPTLIITGDEDDPCLEPALLMKRSIRTSGLVVLPCSGHTINIEEPEAFNRAVLEFLIRVDEGRAHVRDPRSAASGILGFQK